MSNVSLHGLKEALGIVLRHAESLALFQLGWKLTLLVQIVTTPSCPREIILLFDQEYP